MTDKKPINAADAARESSRAAEEALGRIDAREDAEKKIEEDKPDTLWQKVKDMTLAARRINKVWDAATELYDRIKPVIRILATPVTWTFGQLKDIFVWNAFEHDHKGLKLDKDGDPIFNPGRLMRAFATAAVLGNMAFIGGAGIMFHLTNETVYSYVTNKQMERPGELYEVTGAESLPSSTEADNGQYFHIQDSLMYPNLWRPEQDVYALIPQGNAVCKHEVHGIYMKAFKLLHKQAQWYQNIYETSCYPLSDVMIEDIAANGVLPEVMYNQMMPDAEIATPAMQTPADTTTPQIVQQQSDAAQKTPAAYHVPVTSINFQQPGLTL